MLILIGHIAFVIYGAIRLYLIRSEKDEDNSNFYDALRGKLLGELGVVYTVMIVITFVITLLLF